MDNGSGVFTYQDNSSDDEDFHPYTQLTPQQRELTEDPRLYHATEDLQRRAFDRYAH